MMRTFLWMLTGCVLGAAATFGIGLLLPEIIPISQAEGAYMMGVAFAWTPLGAVVGGLAALVWRLQR